MGPINFLKDDDQFSGRCSMLSMNNKLSRILYVTGSLDLGGAEKHLSDVLPRLRQAGFDVAVFSITTPGFYAKELQRLGVPVYAAFESKKLLLLPKFIRNLVLFVASVVRLVITIRDYRPKTLHMFLPAAYIVGATASVISPKVNLVMSRRSRNLYQKNYFFIGRLERFLHRRMDVLLGNSMRVLQDLVDEGAPPDRLRLIYNGVSTSDCAERSNTDELRSRFGIDVEDVVFVVVANLIPYKGHADLIKAFGSVKNRMDCNWVLLVVGEDRGILDDLRSLAFSEGISSNVRWLGARNDVDRILSICDVGVLCSHEEGFSNALLEYMSAGLPVIVTDVGGNSEVVVSKLNGEVVPVKDVQSIGGSILKLTTNKKIRDLMGIESKKIILDRFTLDRCVGKYILLYRHLHQSDRAHLPVLDEDQFLSLLRSKKSS